MNIILFLNQQPSSSVYKLFSSITFLHTQFIRTVEEIWCLGLINARKYCIKGLKGIDFVMCTSHEFDAYFKILVILLECSQKENFANA